MAENFLVEIGTEELPPKSLKTLSDTFAAGIEKHLKKAALSFTQIKTYASPRRLATIVERLEKKTAVKKVAIWGPPAKVAFDTQGNHTKAAQAFAKKNNVSINDLKTESDGKIEKLVYRTNSGGVLAADLLGGIISASLAELPIAKRMRWGTRRVEFVRPVHWVVMLLGNDIIHANILGLPTSRETRGHRFHCNQPLALDNPSEYVEKLFSPGFVVADFSQRREKVRQQVQALAAEVQGTAIIDDELLEEVTALVEWPVALRGEFEKRFLSVPAEALISSMKEHQKYFHVVDSNSNLLPYFITVSNIESREPALVVAGNERVIRPRLADAAFFFETDKKITLEAQRQRLKSIVFQAKLGSVFDKTQRIALLAENIARQLSANTSFATRAAQLSKSDLVTTMVNEFSSMQGVAGYYYALNDDEEEEVALALNEQYLPRFAGDQLPTTATGTILALSDRLDTLVGIFGIGQSPSGSKDPFALRRASLGVLRLLIEKKLDLDLRLLLSIAAKGYGKLPNAKGGVDRVLNYMLERLRAWYEDDNIPVAVFLAVNAKQVTKPLDFNKRVCAVHQFSQLAQAQALAAANKRVSNILSKQKTPADLKLNKKLLLETAEKLLAAEVDSKAKLVAPLFADGKYADALEILADLRSSVDGFFDSVMVMTEDVALQNNRLALLAKLRGLFLEVADISLLAPAKG